MKILLIITRGEIGGAQVSVFNLAKELKLLGNEIQVGSGEGNFLSEKLAKEKINFHRFAHLKRTHNPIHILLFIVEFYFFLQKNKFDVIHFNSSNTLWGAISVKIANIQTKTVFTFRGLSLLDRNYVQLSLTRYIYQFLFKFLLLFIDEQVFVSQENKNYAELIGISKKSTVIYNGLDDKKIIFLPQTEARQFLEKKLNIPLQDKFIIGSVGRLAYQKNFAFMIEALASILRKNKNFLAILVGDGPEYIKLRQQVSRLNLSESFFFAGGIPDAYQLLRAFDLFILPSRYEGLSITIIEALGAGLPILASDAGGNHELLTDCGKIFPLDNTDIFQAELNELIQNKNLRASLAIKAQNKFPTFSIKKTVAAYAALYQK